MIDRLVTVCLFGSVLFAGVLALELRDRGAMVPAEMVLGPRASGLSEKAATPPVSELLATIQGRPLFAPDRRPAQRTSTDGAKPPGLDSLRLTGVVIEPDRRLAIFVASGAKPLIRSEGDTVNDWRVDAISPDAVSLSGPMGTVVLLPQPDPALAKPGQAASPAIGRATAPPVAAPSPPVAEPSPATAPPPAPVDPRENVPRGTSFALPSNALIKTALIRFGRGADFGAAPPRPSTLAGHAS